VGIFKYNTTNNTIDDDYLLIGEKTDNYPSATGGAGSSSIVSCGIDEHNDLLYYISTNKWGCASNFKTDSAIVRVNLTTFDFIDRTLLNSFPNKEPFSTNSYWEYKYINYPLTSTLIKNDSLWIGFDNYYTGIWKLNIFGENIELLFQYQKITKEISEDGAMFGEIEYERRFQQIKFSFLLNNKLYFIEDTKYQDARVMEIDYEKEINDNTTRIFALDGTSTIENIKFDKKNEYIYILAGALSSELYKYDFNFTKLNINVNCNIDFLKFPTDWGKISNIELDKNAGFIYVLLPLVHNQAGIALIDLNTFELDMDSHLKFGKITTYDYGNGNKNTYYQTYTNFNITVFDYKNGELLVFPNDNAYYNNYIRLSLTGCAKGKGIVNTLCESCNPGKYSDYIGSDCKSCLPGYSNNKFNSYNCIKCDAGTYSENLNNIECEECPSGYYNSEFGSNICKGCPKGKYSIVTSAINSENCVECDSGKISAIGDTSCSFCHLGEWAKDQRQCEKCPKGTYGESVGLSSYKDCLNCPIGKFSDISGIVREQDCKECAIGKIGVSVGSVANDSCIICEEGKWRENLATCSECPEGWISVTNKKKCLFCELGKWANQKKSCLACPKGRYGDSLGLINYEECVQCPIGKFSDISGIVREQDCKECEIGKIGISEGVNSNKSCILCEEGKWRENLATCNECPDGWISEKYRRECLFCELGKWADSKRVCIECPLGKYSSGLGLTSGEECIMCPIGKYNELNGIVNEQECKSCNVGKIGIILGAVNNQSCILCDTGKYRINIESCGECPHGWVSDQYRESCEMCNVGKYSSEFKAGCIDCPAGYYSDIPGLSFFDICKTCDAGKYSASTGASNKEYCQDCPLGKYSFVYGIKSEGECKTCPIGYYRDNNEQSGVMCIKCQVGEYLISVDRNCESCIEGKFSNDIVNNYFQYCEDCPFGKYSELIGGHKEESCVSCPPGKWNNKFGSNSSNLCAECPVGTYSEEIGAISVETCMYCVAGKYNSDTGANSPGDCRDCATGSFSLEGKAVCKNCPAGQYSNKMASTVCIDCEIGRYSKHESSILCLDCPLNSEHTIEKTGCICSEGSYNTINLTYIQCDTCSSEYICEKGSDISSLKLKQNYWRHNEFTIKTYKCKNRFACKGGLINGTSDTLCNEGHKGPICDICEKGWAKDDGVCLKCPENVGRTMSLTILIPLICILLIIFLIKTANPSNNKKEEVNGVVKIFMNYAQVFSLASSFQINWPSLVRYFFERAKEFSSPRVSFYSSDCAIGWDYYDKLTVYLALPLVYILMVTFVIFLVSLCFCQKKKKKLKRLQSVIEQNDFKASQPSCLTFFIAWEKTAIVVGTFLSWPTIVEKTLEVLNCEKIGDKYYLVKDVSVECYNSQHYVFSTISYVALGVYGIGIPLLGFRLLYKYRYRLFDMQNRYDGSTPLSFLFLGYREKRWYYEFIIMGKKACLILISVFLRNYPRYQIIAASLLIQVSFFLHVFLRPYDTITSYGMICNKLESISLLSLVMTLSTGLFFGTVDSGYELGLFEDVLIVLLLMCNGGIAFYFFIYFVVLGFKTCKQHLKERLQGIFDKEYDDKICCCCSEEKKEAIKEWAFSEPPDDLGIHLKTKLEKDIFVNYFKEKQSKLNVLNKKIDNLPKRRLSTKLDKLRSEIQVMEKQRCWNTVQNNRLYIELRKTVLLNNGKLTDKEKEELNKVFELYIHHGIKFNKKMNNLYMSDLEGMMPEDRENIILEYKNALYNDLSKPFETDSEDNIII